MYLISGMHRSGTSLIARFFWEAGADLGDTATFYRADQWNPDGYFEQPEIHAINMPLIHGPWGKLAYFRLPTTLKILARAEHLSEQIDRTADKYSQQVVKETRFCLTLPAWRAHGASLEGITLCLRHPTEVARSLGRRNRIPHSIAYKLWQIHLERVLEHTHDIPTRFIRYENVLDENLAGQELCPALECAGVVCDDDRIRRLHGKLVRQTPGLNTRKTPPLPPSVAKLWNELLQRHADQF